MAEPPRGWTYEHDGQRHRLPLTEPESWQRDPWPGAVGGLERRRARAATRRAGASPPASPGIRSRSLAIEYALSEEGLRVSTTATNVGTEACPYGSGAHPYLKVAAETVDDVVLRVPARIVLRSDERGIPVGTASVDEVELDFRIARPIGAAKLDHCFTDLERGRTVARVELHSPEGVF